MDFGLNTTLNNNGIGLEREILFEEKPSSMNVKDDSFQTHAINNNLNDSSIIENQNNFTQHLNSKTNLKQLSDNEASDNKYLSLSDYQLDEKDISQLATQIQVIFFPYKK